MAIDEKELKRLLEHIDANLIRSQTICLIGSGATILLGQPARATEDLDVWSQASNMEIPDFRQAVEKSGMGFDPKDMYPTLPYVQIIHPGIVQVPGFDPKTRKWFDQDETVVWSGRKLTVTCPPAESIIASKLVRGEDRDLADCIWIMASHRVSARVVELAIRNLPREARELAADNMEVLSLLKK